MALRNVVTRIKALITADNKDLKKKMKESSQVTKKTGMDFKKMGQLIAGSLVVVGLVKFGKAMLNIGKSLDLMNTKATAVFGLYKKEVEGMADDTAASMGLTKTEFINAAAGIQDLLVPIGFARKEATGMTKDMMSLSGALSAWTGGTVSATEVGNIFAKAMLGEREQLKTLGIALSDAEIQTELLARGQKTLTGDLLAQAKAQITLDLITAKSTDAQAAFKEGGDGLVLTMAETGANIRSMGESLAIILNPAMEKGAGAAKELTGELRELLDEAAIVSSSDVITTWEKWQYRIASVTGGLAGMIKRMEILGMAMSEADFDAIVQEIVETGGTLEDVEKQMATFGELAVAHAKKYYVEAKKLRDKDAAEVKATEAQKLAEQKRIWEEQLAAYRKIFADMQKAQEEFDKALRSTHTEAYIAAMSITKVAVATYQAGVEMDKIPEKGALAALGIANYGIGNATAKAHIDATNLAMKETSYMGLAIADTMYSVTNAVLAASSQANASFADTAKAAVNAARTTIAAYIAQGVAAQVESAMSEYPFPYGLIAAAIAGAAAGALFNTIIPSFAEGGVVNGPTLAMVGDNPSGREAMIPSELWGSLGGIQQVQVTGQIRAGDIKLVSDRYQNKLERTGRVELS